MTLSRSLPLLLALSIPMYKMESWGLQSVRIDGFLPPDAHGTPMMSRPHHGPWLLLDSFNTKASLSDGKGLTAQPTSQASVKTTNTS